LTVLSLPYYQPAVIKSVGSELQPLANSLLQGGCQTTGSSTTLPTTITTSVSSSQTTNAINFSGTFLENFVFLGKYKLIKSFFSIQKYTILIEKKNGVYSLVPTYLLNKRLLPFAFSI
jgi:hypothetical protein